MSSFPIAKYDDPAGGSLQVMEPNKNSLGGGSNVITPVYNLPPASNLSLGGVKIGAGINIASDGTISVTASGGIFTPVSFTAITDEAIVAPRLLYMKSNGHFGLADNSAEGKEPVGLCITNVAVGANATVVFAYNLITGLLNLTPGAVYYLGTAGGLVAVANVPTAAGSVLIKIGTALSASTLLYAPEMPITL